MDAQWRAEQAHLDGVMAKIRVNLALLEGREADLEIEVKQLYDDYHAGDDEALHLLDVALPKQRLLHQAMEANRKAAEKAYFGKIVYTSPDKDESLYIGKKGVSDQTEQTSLLIVDWRAPVSELYYNAALGASSYHAPKGEVAVNVENKLTLEIAKGVIKALFDSEVVTNDALLVEYLSKNKDVVLNEIVATIQKEQNDIIRVEPWKNVVVQGVAGSGKTTVAMHRISYLLYNYDTKLSFQNVYVVASSKLFLNYITAMLPDLDVPEIKQGTLAELLTACVQQHVKSFKPKALAAWTLTREQEEAAYRRLNTEIFRIERAVFPHEPVTLFGVTLLRAVDIAATERPGRSLSQRAAVLDTRIDEVIELEKHRMVDYITSHRNDEATIALARKLFGITAPEVWEVDLQRHLRRFQNACKNRFAKRIKAYKAQEVVNTVLAEIEPHSWRKSPDLAEAALTALAAEKLTKSELAKQIKHIVIDEAQDFSPLVYRVLREVFNEATFTVVGDVCQNINPLGLNSWEELTDDIFSDALHFSTLTKSYRNTIEINDFANQLVAPYFGQDFLVEPVVRHGKPVCRYANEGKVKAIPPILQGFEASGYQMCAVVCKTREAAVKLSKQLKLPLLEVGEGSLSRGVVVSDLKNTKGLEFDAVVIWDFDEYTLEQDSPDVKMLYVAMTRALHELHLFGDGLV